MFTKCNIPFLFIKLFKSNIWINSFEVFAQGGCFTRKTNSFLAIYASEEMVKNNLSRNVILRNVYMNQRYICVILWFAVP